jgi:hypothetical protein
VIPTAFVCFELVKGCIVSNVLQNIPSTFFLVFSQVLFFPARVHLIGMQLRQGSPGHRAVHGCEGLNGAVTQVGQRLCDLCDLPPTRHTRPT